MAKYKDPQLDDVISWHYRELDKMDTSTAEFSQAQSLINYIWGNEGLEYPPRIVPIANNTINAVAHANRFTIAIRENIKTIDLLHELAHSMTMDFDHTVPDGGFHGRDFVGMMMKLIGTYIRIPMSKLTESADRFGVHYNLNVKPVMLDID